MIALSVNLNKIALVRNSRPGNHPDLLEFADTCLDAGCHGITVHPRPDQRHIRPGDCRALAARLGSLPGIEFNIEGNPFAAPRDDYPGLLELAMQCRPDQCTLVPDSNDQLTSDHGFDLRVSGQRLQPIIRQLHDEGIRVSLFMDPDPEQIALAGEIGADRIELYTGPFAWLWEQDRAAAESLYQTYADAARHALALGIGVNAGHDLNLDNLVRFRDLPGLLEVSIGHALTIDALRLGMRNAVSRYLAILAGEDPDA